MMIQPIVSSMIAAATITWPTVRRRKPTSRMTIATIFTDEIDSAVARKSVVISRLPGSGSTASGSSSPSPKPNRNGMATPQIEVLNAARRELRTTDRSVSIPVSRSRSKMPNCATASIIAFWLASAGNSTCSPAGHNSPSTDGPRRIPAINWPMTAGWPRRTISSPISRPRTSNASIWPRKITSEGPLVPSAAMAAEGAAARTATSITGIRRCPGLALLCHRQVPLFQIRHSVAKERNRLPIVR